MLGKLCLYLLIQIQVNVLAVARQVWGLAENKQLMKF